jgi:addiction module RelE/StbE family toxin
MKQIRFTKTFEKSFKKRIISNPNLSKNFAKRLKLFQENPKNPLLRDHALVGTKIDKRAFSISGDIRVVFGVNEDFLVFYDVGSHNQVY